MNRAIRGLALLAVMGAVPAFSQLITLTDGNATATIRANNVANYWERGMTGWTTDGVNHLFNQWFYYRIGNDRERTIDTISAPTVTLWPANANLAKITYQNSLIKVETTYLLTGGSNGSGRSDIAESIPSRT